MVEYLTEIVPGLIILGCLLLWWQAHVDLCSLRREWLKLVSTLSEADSWDEAITVLEAYGRDTDT